MSLRPPEIVTTKDRGVARTDGEQYLFDALMQALRDGHLDGWRIYEQPHLNGDRPDFVLMHPERGVVVVEVKDWNLRHPEHALATKSPVAQLLRYRKNILESYARSYLALVEAHGDQAFAVIETVVYFHHACAAAARDFLQRTTPQLAKSLGYTTVIDRHHVDALMRGDLGVCGVRTVGATASKFAREGLLEDLVNDLDGWMRPIDYGLGREKPIALDTAQKRHAALAPGVHRRLKGVAGAGKSVVLASRAAALLEAGQRVLVLTYNITLQHFLRDLVRQQYTGRSSRPVIDDLVIHHFHGFLRSAADKLDVLLEEIPHDPKRSSEVLEVGWPQQLLERVASPDGIADPDLRFDAILIDEGQDFSNLWVSLALRFLTERDELLIAFDTRQNLYDRDLVWLDAGGDVQGLGFSGPPAQLKHSHRLPDAMATVSNAFAARYFQGAGRPALSDDAIDGVQGGLFDSIHHLMRWENHPDAKPADLVGQALRIIEFARRDLGAHANDLVVLADKATVAVPLIHELKDAGYAVTHVFDDRDALAEGDDAFRYKRSLKWQFQPADGRIKVCTIHSFKGWEAPYVIGLLCAPTDTQLASEADFGRKASMIYIGLTRLKRANDGSSSLFAFVNGDPRFNDVEAIVRQANVTQVSTRVVPRAKRSDVEPQRV